MQRVLWMVACVPFLWMGCQGCGNGVDAEAIRINQTNQDDLEYGGDPLPSAEEEASIRKGVNEMVEASNVRDWPKHLQYYLPNIFKDSTELQGWIDMAQRYDSIGWRSEFTALEIDDVSPFVPYVDGRAAVINADFTNEVSFTEDFKGIPGQYLKMLEGRYQGSATVKYDSLAQVYTAHGRDHWYAFVPDSSGTCYYIQGKSLTDHGIAQLFNNADLQRLLSYRR